MKMFNSNKLFKLSFSLLGITSSFIFFPSITNCNINPFLIGIKIYHETEYGGIVLSLSDEEKKVFTNYFEYGDSLRFWIYDSNNNIIHSENDIPFYNGYYGVDKIAFVMYLDSSSPIVLTVPNSNDDVWNTWNVNENCYLNVKLNCAKQYKEIQDALYCKMSYDKTGKTDEVFANFRQLRSGNNNDNIMKDDFIYRASSPTNNQIKRDEICNNLMESNKITFDINISDQKEDLEKTVEEDNFKVNHQYYYNTIYKNKNYTAKHYKTCYYGNDEDLMPECAKRTFETIIDNGTQYKYLIHCIEGKDRTGFICTLLQCLCNATYEYMRNDFLKSFENLFDLNFSVDSHKLEIFTKIFFISNALAPICFPNNKEDEYFEPDKYKNLNFKDCGEAFLKEKCHFTDEKIEKLEEIICK